MKPHNHVNEFVSVQFDRDQTLHGFLRYDRKSDHWFLETEGDNLAQRNIPLLPGDWVRVNDGSQTWHAWSHPH